MFMKNLNSQKSYRMYIIKKSTCSNRETDLYSIYNSVCENFNLNVRSLVIIDFLNLLIIIIVLLIPRFLFKK